MKCHDFYLLFVTKYKFKLIKGLNKKRIRGRVFLYIGFKFYKNSERDVRELG